MEAHAIINPENGELAVTAKGIMKTSLEYCKKVLTKNEIQEGFEKEVALKQKCRIV